jgi:uncharacterized membrane protein
MAGDEAPDNGAPATSPGLPAGRLQTYRHWFRARLRTYFFAGVLVTAPIAITIWLAWQIIEFFDQQVRALIPARYSPDLYVPLSIPGIGLVVFVVAMTLIGALTAGYLGARIVKLGERLLARMPVVRSIYGAVKQIFEAVLAQKSNAFRQVVLVEFPRKGMWSLGFVSGETQGEIRDAARSAGPDAAADELINVFIPTTPNPTSGYLMFVPRREAVVLSMTVEEGIKMVVSGGIVTPPDRRPRVAAEPVEPIAVSQ